MVGVLPVVVVAELMGVRGVSAVEARRVVLPWEVAVAVVMAVAVIMVAVPVVVAIMVATVEEEMAVAVVAVRVLFQGFPVVMPLMLQEAIRENRNITADMFLKIPVCRMTSKMGTGRYASP